MKKKKKSNVSRAKRTPRTLAYPVEFRLRMVRLHLEEGYSKIFLLEQFGVSNHSIRRWVQAYRAHGVEGLEPKRRIGGRSRMPVDVRERVVKLKQDHPEYGPRRIADVLKRDNGGNLNHATVDDVLEAAWVIPVNSPPYTAPYNGAIEHTQGEFKSYVKRWQWKANTMESLSLLAETAAHALNHTSRRCLNNHTACRTYLGDNRIRYSKRQRRSIFVWIRDLASEIASRAGKSKITNVEWRVAAKQWLLKNDLIKIEKAGNVSPYLDRKLCHN